MYDNIIKMYDNIIKIVKPLSNSSFEDEFCLNTDTEEAYYGGKLIYSAKMKELWDLCHDFFMTPIDEENGEEHLVEHLAERAAETQHCDGYNYQVLFELVPKIGRILGYKDRSKYDKLDKE